MRYGFITTFLCLALYGPAIAQQHIFKNYSVNDGLVSNSVRRIFQDSKGFLWIATWEGLSKYDGYTFTNYSTANGLSHNLVNDVYEAKNGWLYVALNDGSIDAITDNQVSHISKSAVVNRLLGAPAQPVIAATDAAGLQLFNYGKISRPHQTLAAETFTDITWLNDSLMATASDSCIRIITGSFRLFAASEITTGLFTDAKLYQDTKQRIWVGTYKGLKLLAGIPEKNGLLNFAPLPAPFNTPALTNTRINDILEDSSGTLWIGTNGGLVRTDVTGRQQLITVQDGLASNIITSIFQDRQRNIWLGTAVGLSKLITRSSIVLYPIAGGVAASDNTYLLYPLSKNRMLVSTAVGVQVFDKQAGTFTTVPNSNRQLVFSAVQNKYPPVLVSIAGLSAFDTANLQLGRPALLPFVTGTRVAADKQGGLFSSDLNYLYFSSGTNRQLILQQRISALLIDKYGDVWIGTWQQGLVRLQYHCTGNKLQITKTTRYLPGENIRSLYEDRDGHIWVGTRYNGVYQLGKQPADSLSLSHYDQRKGLSSNFIKAIRQDGRGNIWVAFYQGLDKLVPVGRDSFRIFNFSRINNYFASIIGMETDDDNTVWLATGEGITHIKDGELEKLPPLPVYITKVFSPDSVYALAAQKVQLDYNRNQLQFEFSAPGFINEKQILYSYRLANGRDTQWTPSSNLHNVSYASLQPGHYVFEVRALGWNNEWGRPAAFAFVIYPPFWQRWWFILLMTSALLLAAYAIIQKRIERIQQAAAMKQRIAETEMMALRAQMNPHFIFNCLNSIDNLIQMNEKEKATSYLSKFAKLIRSILETSKNNVVPCWKDMETLQLYLELEALRFDDKFSYKIEVDPAIINGDYKVPPLVIQPFVENAIHHGLLNKTSTDKQLWVKVSASQHQLQYLVEDNGVGRQQAAAYKQLNKPAYQSLGMQITADRIHLFNQHKNGAVHITDLHDGAGKAIGTRVEITLTIQP